jgi:hypothetical protein
MFASLEKSHRRKQEELSKQVKFMKGDDVSFDLMRLISIKDARVHSKIQIFELYDPPSISQGLVRICHSILLSSFGFSP